MEKKNEVIKHTGTLYGVGVGPGESELITKKAIQVIEQCNVIIVPAEPLETSYAYRAVNELVPESSRYQWIAMPFPMTKDEKQLEEFYEQSYQKIEKLLLDGNDIAFLTIGDPTVYSTYMFIDHKAKERGQKTVIINGVPSFCAVASRLGISLGEKEEEIHIIPGSYDIEQTKQFTGTRIYMKSGRKLNDLKQMLEKEAKIRPLEVYAVSNCGLPDEKIGSGMEAIDSMQGYLTIVIVKVKANAPQNSSRFFENRACAYYPCHKGIKAMNCMFCYCPFYMREHCPGHPEYIEHDGKKIKSCVNCTFPHQAENYDLIMKMLRNA